MQAKSLYARDFQLDNMIVVVLPVLFPIQD